MAKKVLQIPVEDAQWNWVVKGMKEFKMKSQAEFLRSIFSYLMENDISDLKTRLEKAHITAMLQEAQAKADYALKVKEELERRLEKISA